MRTLVFVVARIAAEIFKQPATICVEQRHAKVGSIHVKCKSVPSLKLRSSTPCGGEEGLVLGANREGMSETPAGSGYPRGAGQSERIVGSNGGEFLPALCMDKTPDIFRGSYGYRLAYFRPEQPLLAYEFRWPDKAQRRKAQSMVHLFHLGLDASVFRISTTRRPLLPAKQCIRFHSIRGWEDSTGKTWAHYSTTWQPDFRKNPKYANTSRRSKNLGHGQPKYGSEKKGRAH